jgi:tRNA U34 5-carboxymethylaminomethyl modifying GTPase MnmE/TrmE
LVGNKADLDSNVTKDEAVEIASSLGMHYLEVSCKTRQNIEKLYEMVARIFISLNNIKIPNP